MLKVWVRFTKLKKKFLDKFRNFVLEWTGCHILCHFGCSQRWSHPTTCSLQPRSCVWSCPSRIPCCCPSSSALCRCPSCDQVPRCSSHRQGPCCPSCLCCSSSHCRQICPCSRRQEYSPIKIFQSNVQFLALNIFSCCRWGVWRQPTIQLRILCPGRSYWWQQRTPRIPRWRCCSRPVQLSRAWWCCPNCDLHLRPSQRTSWRWSTLSTSLNFSSIFVGIQCRRWPKCSSCRSCPSRCQGPRCPSCLRCSPASAQDPPPCLK